MLEHWRGRSLIGQPALRQLMATRGSFTRALSRLVGEPIQVRVLAQGWRQTPDLGRVFAREVMLCSGAQSWIYALTLMRPRGLKGANRDLRQLQTRPLGELLFTAHSRRLNLHMTRLSAHSRLRVAATGHGIDLPMGSHARCSWFDYNGSALLVHECLLPALLQKMSSSAR